MGTNKKYYWMKLKEDFFDDDAISWLEDQPDGVYITLFYLKLCLKSIRTEGILIRLVGNKLIPYDVKKLSEITRISPEIVERAMKLFKEIGIVEELENGAFFLPRINEVVGSETDKASLMRKKRERDKMEHSNANNEKGNNVTSVLPKHYTEIKRIEKDKDININNVEKEDIPYSEIIDYLNEKASTRYKAGTVKTRTCIRARFNEGFTVEDFKTVIDKKSEEWINTDFEQYLRPETLFGNKFEGYLQAKPRKKLKTCRNEAVNESDENDLDNLF